ncbi:branched-chain amino acid ABC transporter permease [Desulforhopalus singaporensis]|uniref:Branched-chain amino acid transport system permease protein n=1 Tax=Desulforhopalus singaporensis TaxID=91360 RepID=A0A1H0KER6_9BACT|nr:branched-chain amino acid ABC transporter permease [Desulforhopalus singaporensis]SDO54241.1 branched-chain amino acid transport system permease protein [Desulforhopalus singaporensis]
MTQLTQDNSTGFSGILGKICLSPMGLAGLAILFLLPLVPPFNQDYMIRWLISGAIVAAAAVAFDFSAGYLGIVNFGYAAFIGLGAYTSAIISNKIGISPFITIFAGALVSAGLGVLTGIVSLRLRGMFAICFTWFIGIALMGLCLKLDWLTRGPLGLQCDGFFEGNSSLPYYYLILAIMIFTYLVLGLMIRSDYGLAFRAIGQNMEAAMTSGVHPTKYRVINFTMSCFFAGLIGGFYGHYYGILTPELLHTQKTVEVLVIAYIGGRSSLWGGIVAAFPFIFAMELLRSSLSDLPGINLIIYGVFLIAIMVYYPGGVAQFFKNLTARKQRSTSSTAQKAKTAEAGV